MALSNAQKQARWRERHAERRRIVSRISSLLMRQRFAEGRVHKLRVGWYEVNVDEYFLKLAFEISTALKTDKAMKQIQAALWNERDHRKQMRWRQRTDRKRTAAPK